MKCFSYKVWRRLEAILKTKERRPHKLLCVTVLTEVNSLISLYCMYTAVTILIIVYSTLYSVLSVTLCCSIQNLYTVLYVLQMPICVCTQISMRVREFRGVTGKPSPAVRSISKPRSRGIPHYITPSPAGSRSNPARWEPVQASRIE